MGEAKRRRRTSQTTRRNPVSDDSDEAIAAAGGITVAELQELRRRLAEMTSTREGMERFLDQTLGIGNWSYDESEGVWVTPNHQHRGPGRGFYVIEQDGSWFTAVVGERELA
jgi:hypothetical protein